MARRTAAEAAGSPEEVVMDITPLIDVVFLLLVFFLTSIQFRTMEGFLQADIPEAAPPSETTKEDETLTLLLRDTGGRLSIQVNTISIPGESIVDLFDNLEDHLSGVQKSFGEDMPMVVIDAGERLRYKYVVSALNVCGRLKIENISFMLPGAGG